MGYWEGMLGGFQGRKSEVEKQNFLLGQQASAREARVFEHLMTSDDPEIQQLALTGLLDTANPRRKSKGLKGWIGETEASPFLGQIQQLMKTPVQEQTLTEQPGEAMGLPGPVEGLPTVKPTIQQAPTSAGMPTTSLVDQTQPQGPPVPQTYTQTGPPIPSIISHPRRVFLTGADKVRAERAAQTQGDLEGQVLGLSQFFGQKAAADMVKQSWENKYRHGLARPQSIQGEIPDGQGGYVPAFGVFQNGTYVHPETGQPLAGFRPRTTTATMSARPVNSVEMVAHELFGQPGEDPRALLQRLTPEQTAQVTATIRQREQTQAGAVAGARTTAEKLAEAAAPLSRMNALQATQSLRDDWFKVAAPQEAMKRQLGTLTAAESAIKRGDIAAGSEAAIVTFEKMLDSLSVVRESEYLRPAFNQSLYDRVAGYLETLRTGGARMTPEVLGTYIRLARDIGREAQTDFNKHRVAIERTARAAGIDPANVFGALATTAPPPTPTSSMTAPAGGPPTPTTLAPTVGETVMYQGKRYKVIGVTNGQAELEALP